MGNSTSNPNDPNNGKRSSGSKRYSITQDYKLTQNILGKGGSSHVVEAIAKKSTQTIIHEKRNSRPKTPVGIHKQPSIIQEEKTGDFDHDSGNNLNVTTNNNNTKNGNNNNIGTNVNITTNTDNKENDNNNNNGTDTPKSNRSSGNKIIIPSLLKLNSGNNNSNISDNSSNHSNSNRNTPKLGNNNSSSSSNHSRNNTPKHGRSGHVPQSSLGKTGISIKFNGKMPVEKCAIKIIGKKNQSVSAESLFTREISILEELQGHPNILQLYDYRETKANFYIIMQLCNGGSLMKRIQTLDKEYRINETNGAVMFKDILSCIQHCHNKNVVHCDLKPG